MNELFKYEDAVTDVIIGLHDMGGITPSDIVAIYNVLRKYNVSIIPKVDLYHLFEEEKHHNTNVKSVTINQKEIIYKMRMYDL